MEDMNETAFLEYCKENSMYISNVSTPETVERLIYTQADIIITSIIMPILLVSGWISNSSFLFVVYRVKYMHTITNLYLVNLAISDVTFLSFAVGDKLWRYASSEVYLDNVAKDVVDICVMYLFMNTAYFSSQFLISLVAVDRYYAVCKPLEQYKLNSLTRAVTLIMFSWSIAFIFAASMTPAYVKRKTVCILWPDDAEYDDYPQTYVYFAPLSDPVKVYVETIQTIPFFINVVFETILYILIIRGLNSRVSTRTNQGIAGGKIVEIRNQVTRMLIINGIIYILLMSSFQVYSLMTMASTFREARLSKVQLKLFLSIARVLVYTNAVVNPIIYNLSSQRYRRAFSRAFSCRGSKFAGGSFCVSAKTYKRRGTYAVTSSTIAKSVTHKNEPVDSGDNTRL